MRFVGVNRIILANSVIDAMPSLQHDYGKNAEHKLTVGFGDSDLLPFQKNDNMSRYDGLKIGSPEWEQFDNHIARTMGDSSKPRVGLHDFAAAHNIPGMHHQTLAVTPFQDGRLHTQYWGAPDKHSPAFYYDMTYKRDPSGRPAIDWEMMRNESKNPALLSKFMKRAVPFWQRAGIHHVDTNAVSNDGTDGYSERMNGGMTWGNLGFGFQDPREAEKARTELHGMLKQHYPEDVIHQEMGGMQYPYDFINRLRRLNKEHPTGQRIAQLYNGLMKRAGIGNLNPKSDYFGFSGRLNLDPRDRGYQRMMSFMGRA